MNKEIEELLNKLYKLPLNDEYKLKYSSEDIDLSDIKLLLSYIEQLEIYDKNKVLNDWFEDERKINVLQNNRDKAIEFINKVEGPMAVSHKLILKNILKGGSDENGI